MQWGRAPRIAGSARGGNLGTTLSQGKRAIIRCALLLPGEMAKEESGL